MTNQQPHAGPTMSFGGRRSLEPVKMTLRARVITAGVVIAILAILTPIALLLPTTSARQTPAPQPAVTHPTDDTVTVNGLLGGLPF